MIYIQNASNCTNDGYNDTCEEVLNIRFVDDDNDGNCEVMNEKK